MKRFSIYAVFLLFPLLTFQHTAINAQGKQAKIVCIAFYNLENLFDTVHDPNIDDLEFTPTGSGRWDSKRYYTKLSHLAEVISQIGDEYIKNGPVFIGVSEVENRAVVEDLVHTPPLKSMGYDIVHFDSPDRRGIDVALLYQPKLFHLKSTKTHTLKMPNDTGFRTRDILQVDGFLDEELVHVLVNHWPSRSGGEKESVPKRDAAADLCLTVVKEIYKDEPDAKIIVMGDLNDDPVDESLMKHLKIKTKPENVSQGDLFDPMWQLFRDGVGSLAYRDSWNLFDQIIVSSALMDKKSDGYRYFKAKVFNKKFLVEKDGPYAGYPFRTYSGGVYTGGYSDHFPVYLFLVKEIR
ncbi:MAG: endonuclease/exonuclease/phosphatase family protein [Bacteroidales bacterium]